MTIEILVCTLDEGISDVDGLLLPPLPDVKYLVAWQQTHDRQPPLPARWTQRSDLRVLPHAGSGLSRNRNFALSHAEGDWLVIADDDNRYTPAHLQHLRWAIQLHPDAAALQLQATDYAGRPLRNYPSHAYEYHDRPRGTYVASYELALRRDAPLPAFDTRFGLGASLGCGEEEVFIHQLAASGQHVWYEPMPLVMTDAASTGTRFARLPAVQRAKGGVLCLMHGPWSAALRCLKYALTQPRLRPATRFTSLWQMFKGIAYVLTHHPLP
ncbi:MAG: glycosyltransferase [Alloprevotella sp.]